MQERGTVEVSDSVGCVLMIWEATQRATAEKRNIDVVWYDLKNSYGLVSHVMIQILERQSQNAANLFLWFH